MKKRKFKKHDTLRAINMRIFFNNFIYDLISKGDFKNIQHACQQKQYQINVGCKIIRLTSGLLFNITD